MYIRVTNAVTSNEDNAKTSKKIINELILYGNAKLYGSGNIKAINISGIHLNVTDDNLEDNILVNHIKYKLLYKLKKRKLDLTTYKLLSVLN